jgi:Fe2+ transport system protein B
MSANPESASPPQRSCEKCPMHNAANLRRLGVNTEGFDHIVALLGNPNTGKSTVFNALTGLRQHVGNWTGKTVARAEGAFRHRDKTFKLVDLPGAYSLFSSSHHEEIARDFVLFGQPDVTVVVVDATRLERNLVLVLQALEITDRVVVALNLMDEARRHAIEIDVRALSRRLGIPVVPMAARQGEGIPDLLRAIEEIASGAFVPNPRQVNHQSESLERALAELVPQIEAEFPHLPNARWVALRLLDGDHSIIQAIREGTLGNVDQMEQRAMPSLNRPGLTEET